jgi:trigger factor
MEKYLEDEGQTTEEFEATSSVASVTPSPRSSSSTRSPRRRRSASTSRTCRPPRPRAQQSGQDPQEFANHMFEHNHIPDMVQEILRGKALATLVESATVTDASGNVVELANLRPDGTIGEPAPTEASNSDSEAAEEA